MLKTYGIQFPDDLKEELDKYVAVSFDENAESSFPVQESILNEDRCSPSLLLSVKVNCKCLRRIISHIQDFLDPVMDDKNVWISLHKSQFFRLYFDLHFKESPDRQALGVIDHFHNALAKTKEVLVNLLKNGDATWEDVTLCRKIQFETLKEKIDESDIQKVAICLIDGIETLVDCRGLRGLTSSLKFFSFILSLVEKFYCLCKGLDLSGCIEDEKFEAVEKIYNEMNSPDCFKTLTLEKLTDYVDVMEKNLMLPGTELYTDLFHEVLESTEFYHFVRTRYYDCTEPVDPEEKKQRATISFRQTIEFVQHQLENADYEEQVLLRILPAFNYILPFMNKQQGVFCLIEQVKLLSRETAFEELKVVRENFQDVEKWLKHVRIFIGNHSVISLLSQSNWLAYLLLS